MACVVLHISPNASDAASLSRMMADCPLSFVHVPNVREANRVLKEQYFPVILTEVHLEDGDWKEVLAAARQAHRETEVVVTVPAADVRLWAEVINLGGYDILVQPFESSEVHRVLLSAAASTPAHLSIAV
ncbi:MAG: hypothetical protein IPM24_17920 [Bryobacterales bacterium]|jgi:DNA-binding NtrC family response regulator|nr:hypothetical protein [Bryobacterales bacterium]